MFHTYKQIMFLSTNSLIYNLTLRSIRVRQNYPKQMVLHLGN